MAFDPAEYIKTRNEAEAAQRAGQIPELAKTEKVPDPPAQVADDNDDEPAKGGTPDPARSARRRENRLREQAAEERGRRIALEELVSKGLMPHQTEKKETVDDKEPERKDYPDDAQYNRALGRWDARQEAQKLLEGKDNKEEAKRQEEAWMDGVKKMDVKAAEDVKLIPDFDEVAKKATEEAEDDDSLKFTPAEQPTFYALLMQSDVRVFMYHHFAKNPDDLRKILAMTPTQQIPFFNRLEGKVEKMYSTEQKPNVPEKKEPTAAERDVKKSKPTESGAPRGGAAPSTTVKPYLEDGRTINPAWKAQQNEREGLRR